jgi:EAL domain-containing protein (putative c-di-GMP-specific phosphodiesterase class I)
MSVSAMERLDLENSLRKALDNSEFIIHYLPIVDIHKNEVAGVEALLRWEHPEKGLINPHDFMDVAIECGLIVPISEWLIDSVCRQIKAWKNAGMENQNVSINLSTRQFIEKDLVSDLTLKMDEYGVEGSELTIEVREKTLIENEGEIDIAINKLHNMGITIALDDFGTGFASLAYLRNFPIDIVKIDRTFVAGIPENEEDTAVVNAIAGLTRGLKLRLLAEGVENERQLDMLKGLGCQLGQGFYWSKALPADQYEQFYLNRIYHLGGQKS